MVHSIVSIQVINFMFFRRFNIDFLVLAGIFGLNLNIQAKLACNTHRLRFNNDFLAITRLLNAQSTNSRCAFLERPR